MSNQTSPIYSQSIYLPGDKGVRTALQNVPRRRGSWDSHLKAIKKYCKSQAVIYDNCNHRGGTIVHKANNCNSWDCEECRKKKAYALQSRIKAGLKKQTWRLLTLTIDPKEISLTDSLTSFSNYWDVFLKRLKRKYPGIAWIKVLEFQGNGYPHLHVIVNQYIPHPWLKRNWKEITGASIVDIRKIKNTHIAKYVSAYLSHKDKKHHERDHQFYNYSLRRFAFSRNFPIRPWIKRTVVFTRGIDWDCSDNLWNDVIRLLYKDGTFFAVTKSKKIKYINLFADQFKFREC